MKAIVQTSSTRKPYRELCGHHLSDPFCDEESRAFGSLPEAVEAAGDQIRNVLRTIVLKQ